MQALGQSSRRQCYGNERSWGQLRDFLEEGRQTYKRNLDGLVVEGWHNCLVQSWQGLGGWSLEMPLSFRACLYTGEFPHAHKEPEARAAGSSKVSLPPFASSVGSMPGF